MRYAGPRQGRLGTFAGVFTPSVLTILGLILFRRLGYVVGAAGLAQTLVILALSHLISILTSSSLSAIATNVKVRGGGDYYLISRSLGVEFGGAIGIVLFLAQSISVAFYALGFAEALSGALPGGPGPTATAVAAVLFLFVFAWLGADWATRLQYFVMTALAAGLVAFFVGAIGAFDTFMLHANWSGAPASPPFWTLFALFFPAVTGFTQGVSMSGDLENPGRSLPRGTFAAVGVSMVVYAATALLFAGALSRDALTTDYESMARVASVPGLITLGIVAATLSSALASFLGAPRILQALASDRVFPPLNAFATGHGASHNPRRGVLATLAIALVFVAVGGIDLIAPVVSMFFLVSYGLLNYAAAFEARAASPSFRPRFRWFDHRTSLVGALLCLGTMVMVSPLASAVALGLVFALYQYVDRLAPPERWADSRRDHYFQNVRRNLLAMARQPSHARNWRPHLLVFSDAPRRRELLVRFAGWLEGGSGVTTVVRVLEGAGAASAAAEAARKELAEDLAAREMDAFALVIGAPDFDHSVNTLIQAYGVGPIRANTILLNWLEQRGASQRLFAMHLRAAHRLGVNVIVLDAKENEWAAVERLEPRERRIEVWWSDDASSRLMLLLAYLMTRSEEWHEATVRLICRAEDRSAEVARERLRQTLEEYRIDAEIEIVERPTAERLRDLVTGASLVFVPLRLARLRAVDPFGMPVEETLERLPIVALVSAADDIDLQAAPEEGDVGRVAKLQDAMADAARAVAAAEKDAAGATAAERSALEAAEALRAKLEAAPAEAPGSERTSLTAKLAEAEAESRRRARELEDAKGALAAAQEAATRAAEALGEAGKAVSAEPKGGAAGGRKNEEK